MNNKELEERISKLETSLKNLDHSISESDNNIKKLEKLISNIKAQEIWESFKKNMDILKEDFLNK